jgi:hydrophobic/amphiphilic exporter-1 (mainly G- bacteria), HAE1 family
MQRDVMMILAFAVFFAFVVLAVQFNSLRIPGLILGSLPFCVAGMVLLLAATRVPFGATVLIGALVVIAATINEGVLLLTLAEEIRTNQDRTPAEAVIEAAKIRFRPRLMISLMIITGMIPLALNLEAGGEMLQPMAVASIGGLVTVIAVSIFLLPVMYAAVAEHSRGQGITVILKMLRLRWMRRKHSAQKNIDP